MMYQVMVRAHSSAAWEPYAAPTDDPFAAMRLIQLANQSYAEVTILQAESAVALLALLRDVRRGAIPAHGDSPLPGLTSTPRLTVEDPPMEARRWEIEQGPGGDHDQPYEFALPPSREVLTAWLRLLGRRWREKHGGGAAA